MPRTFKNNVWLLNFFVGHEAFIPYEILVFLVNFIFFRRNEKILRDKLIIGQSQVFSIRSYVYLVIGLYSNTGQIGLKRISARYSQFHGRPLYIFQAEKYFFGSFTEPIAHTGSGNKNPHKSPFDSKWARKYFTCFIIHPPCNFCNVWSSSSSLKTCGKLASELRGLR